MVSFPLSELLFNVLLLRESLVQLKDSALQLDGGLLVPVECKLKLVDLCLVVGPLLLHQVSDALNLSVLLNSELFHKLAQTVKVSLVESVLSGLLILKFSLASGGLLLLSLESGQMSSVLCSKPVMQVFQLSNEVVLLLLSLSSVLCLLLGDLTTMLVL